MFHTVFRASVPAVLQLLERFFLSLWSTILTLWAIKKISSLNVKYLGGKSLLKSNLAHNCWGPHAWLLNTRDCQDCIIQNINKDQRLEKKSESYWIDLGTQQEEEQLEAPWTELQLETVLRINTLHTDCCKNHCLYRNLSPELYHGKL